MHAVYERLLYEKTGAFPRFFRGRVQPMVFVKQRKHAILLTMDTVNAAALKAKTDPRTKERLIEEHQAYILRIASKAAKRYITESDDEYAIGLEAFHEASGKYEPEKGDFLFFAAMVIKARIYDYYRKESRRAGNEVLIAGTEMNDTAGAETGGAAAAVREKITEDSMASGKAEMRLEIEQLKEDMLRYGFGFEELERSSPKSKKTREMCRTAIRFILENDLLEEIRKTKQLPMGRLTGELKLSSKKVSRHRKYIITSCEIINGDYTYLKEYFKDIIKEIITEGRESQ